MDEAVITSNDPAKPQVAIPLKGEAGMPRIEVEPTRLDFGSVPITKVIAFTRAKNMLTLKVKNVGDAELKVDYAVIAGATKSPFVFEAPHGQVFPAFVVQPGQLRWLYVFFKPETAHAFEDRLDIHSNDPDKRKLGVPLAGKGAAPRLEVSPASIDFGQVPVGTRAERKLEIKNSGDCELCIFKAIYGSHALDIRHTGGLMLEGGGKSPFSFVAEPVAITLEPYWLPPGATVSVTVRFSPKTIGVFEDKFVITCDDPEKSQFIVPLKGESTPPQEPTADEMLNDPMVKAEIDKAWNDSKADDPINRHEEGGWILQNTKTGELKVVRWPSGTRSSITPSPPPSEADWRVVGAFHTHPNWRPPDGVDENGRRWKKGPSDRDKNIHNNRGIPGIIRDRAGTETFGPTRGTYRP